MSRSIRCLLVGVLVFSLSVDTARACWYTRQARRVAFVPACPPPPAGGGWVVVADAPVAIGWDAWGGAAGWQTRHVVVEEIACGTPVACCGEPWHPQGVTSHTGIVEHDSTVVARSAVVTPAESVAPPPAVDRVIHPEPTLALPATPSREPVPPAVTAAVPSGPALPDLQPVAPASAIEAVVTPQSPVEQPVPAPVAAENPVVPTPQPATSARPDAEPVVTAEAAPTVEPVVPAPQTPAEPAAPAATTPTEPEPAAPLPPSEPAPPAPQQPPAEENLFESVETTTPAAPQPVEPQPVEPQPEAAAAVEQAAPTEEPAATPPASPPAAEPAVEPDPFSYREPARRWIDASGRYAVIGSLRAVGDREAVIVRTDGSTVRVLLERLSDHDRDYAAEAKPRLLAAPRTTPRPTDTAGL